VIPQESKKERRKTIGLINYYKKMIRNEVRKIGKIGSSGMAL
jgi:hypothetical protein